MSDFLRVSFQSAIVTIFVYLFAESIRWSRNANQNSLKRVLSQPKDKL